MSPNMLTTPRPQPSSFTAHHGLLTLSPLIFAFMGCGGSQGGEPGPWVEAFIDDPYAITADLFSIEGDLGPFTSQLHLEEVSLFFPTTTRET